MSANKQAGDSHGYGEACEAWRNSFERYLELARRGASAAALREAAQAVYRAALDKGRYETEPRDDTEH